MRLLLDTHTFLWFITGSPRCSIHVQELIADRSNQTSVSVASLWEISIKTSLGKLAMSIPFDELITEHLLANEIDIMQIELAELTLVARLPFHHRDPFDRLLVAQSLAHSIPLVSADHIMDLYGIRRLW